MSINSTLAPLFREDGTQATTECEYRASSNDVTVARQRRTFTGLPHESVPYMY